jgi:hypothetical protein
MMPFRQNPEVSGSSRYRWQSGFFETAGSVGTSMELQMMNDQRNKTTKKEPCRNGLKYKYFEG